MPHVCIFYTNSNGKECEYPPAETHFSSPTELIAGAAIKKWLKAWEEAQTPTGKNWLTGSSIAIVSDESGPVLPPFKP